ncbi:TetR/AcrR family transcriptional regulator [Curtobacterium sp. P97]|uniref:TetR/AcrR family transcriptional regulator n=1 Tax=Curtobacterium sp. P97 TaxID=2939562 RepID=UPI00204050E5|nr:TetR/AcrR family transcriptional regulator [Curtobacterium sp. P97]MCM3523074.1 TetR/AcrR family transcriptional regulator [Curtobacterium sp. P97]
MTSTAPAIDSRRDVRERIVVGAAELLHDGGVDAVTTRAVAARAGVQAPTIYRLFGDKDGLLDAVAEHVTTVFSAEKAAMVDAAGADGTDPVEALRAGWDATIAFGLANPDLFVIMSDPRRGRGSPAVAAGLRVLEERLRRVAVAGRLLVGASEAVRLVHAAGTGAVLAILGEPEGRRDPALAETVWAAVEAQVVVPERDVVAGPDRALRTAASTLRAGVEELDRLTAAERAVLAEWLDRVAAGRRESDSGGA